MPELPISLPIIILTLTTIVALLLYLREYHLRRRVQAEGDNFLQEIKQKGWNTLHQSIKSSQDILGQAELEGVKVVADARFETDKFVTSAQNQLIQFLNDLQKRSLDFEMASQKSTQDRINQMFERLEQRLTDFLLATEQKATSSIELELKSARQLVETYKEQQLRLIDENIIAMMEKTLSLILSKKLSLKDQLDLIYEALEKAKVEKFIV